MYTKCPVQLHPSSLDFDKKRFRERCHLHLRGHKKTLWTPAQANGREDCGDQEETSFIQVSRDYWSFLFLKLLLSTLFRMQELRARLTVSSLCRLGQKTLPERNRDARWETEMIWYLILCICLLYLKIFNMFPLYCNLVIQYTLKWV